MNSVHTTSFQKAQCGVASDGRYFSNTAPFMQRDAHQQLEASLTRLVTNFPPEKEHPGGGLYNGPLSIAYLFLYFNALYPDLRIADHSMATWYDAYFKEAEKYIKKYSEPKPGRCGIGNDLMVYWAIKAVSTKDASLVEKLCGYVHVIQDPEASNEWLYGKAGYLYLLRFIRINFDDDKKIVELVNQTADKIIQSILKAPRPWVWHGKAYVGAVHGIIGIIMQVVKTDHSQAKNLEQDLKEFLDLQFESGNWPSSLPPERDKLIHFCHGAPGVVASLLCIRNYFPKLKDSIDHAIKKGRECIKKRGLITKEPCLCHGISGNALVLEGKECEHFLSFTTAHEIESMAKDKILEKSDNPSSLWCGEAGRAWAWAVVDKKLEHRFLGYNDI